MAGVNWQEVKACFEIVKNREASRAEGPNFKVYSMGEFNPVIRIDIKVKERMEGK